ncbi:MAG: DNA-directed RNA polymerase subunit beta' [Bacilli bacterium]|jgi:DNA-directed RNA polymerase subunit beta'|nr:DNA-directed RNA polymerase subunit beta' [Bacilli bacterium]MCH4202359.1 DNA-directed RNA polymerase subunit beta' [Bacilli bacterium]
MFDVNRLAAMKVGLASPEKIRSWSHGEVKKPETINYRSQKPEMEGLFCERIFGPSKDYECHCGKYKRSRNRNIVCEKCGVEVISSEVRRERMGHIELASPCSHIWYLKGIPSRMGLILDVSPKQLEEVIYFAGHICLSPGTSKVLYYKEYLDEKVARDVFKLTIQEFKDTLPEGSYEAAQAEEIVAKMENVAQPFDFYTVSKFISKYTGAEFGEGAEAIKRLLKEIDLDKEFNGITESLKNSTGQRRQKDVKRLEVIEAFRNSENRPEWMILDVIPVIPPDLRPMLQLDGGRFATSDLNDLYRRVITRNNRLKKLIEMNAPSVILMNEKRMLQEAVDALIDNGRRNKPVTGSGGRPLKSLSSALKGKQGRFRQNLLGKRVDYSGRSVIAVGPSLKMYQCGIPVEMAIQLFRPFIASVLISEGKANGHRNADKLIDKYDESVFDIIERIIGEHPVLLNRAPTLHRLGIQAFQPVLVQGRAIRLHPLVCTGFNADFDGDQMAVHVPLGKAAQEEALDLMLASNNILGPKDGRPIVTPSQDMVIGNYYLTTEEDKEEFSKRAEDDRARGDEEEAALYDMYAASEGKVFKSIEEVLLAYQTKQVHLHNRIAIPGAALKKKGFTVEMNNSYMLTTVGKIIFNLIFPADFPYVNEPTKENLENDLIKFFVPRGTDIKSAIASTSLRSPVKKGDISKIIDSVFHRYGTSKTSAVLDKIKDQGFRFSTVAGLTVGIADIRLVEGKNQIIANGDSQVAKINHAFAKGLLTETERHAHVIETWQDVSDKVKDALTVQFDADKHNPLFMMKDSGARGNISNFLQLEGMRGLMSSPNGDTIELPIKSCFREGISVSEFFIASHGSRKGGADTALKTADSGYLTRRLVDVAQDVIVREDDCHSDHGFVVTEISETKQGQKSVIVSLADRLIGRYAVRDIVDPETGELLVKGNTLINEDDAKRVGNSNVKSVEIRSLFGCETKDGVCRHCYGRNLATGKEVEIGDAVGVMAAQSIGEPGTQLTMRTFHTGGVAGGEDVTQGLPRVQELFEARNPKGEAVISEISGFISGVSESNGRFTIEVKNDLESKTYLTNYGARLRVSMNQEVKNGERLTEGTISPKKLLEVSDITAVENYILNEVQKVYRVSAAVNISDKHIEVIIRQMLRKVVVVDGGDTELLPGMRVNVIRFTDINEQALNEGKRPAVARPLILGITKAALETESFLSAASFQETTRVLTDAAIKGKIDPLHGLKENVITGKLIPAGRGMLTREEETGMLDAFEVREKMEEVDDHYKSDYDK